MKECNKPETGCDYNCLECEIPQTEPEDCEHCLSMAEEDGIEYEANFIYDGNSWICENCR